MTAEDSRRLTEYVSGAYKRLERDFINYLDYVPLREVHLCVSSQRLADFIIRIDPLLSTCFRLITFGDSMKSYCESSITIIPFDDKKIEFFYEKLEKLYNKKEIDKDTLWDYYKFHDSEKLVITVFWNEKRLSMHELEIQEKIGISDCFQIRPFGKKEWDAFKECRNAIVHRDKTEASLEDVLHGIACLAIIFEIIKIRSRGRRPIVIDSNLFLIPKIKWG